MPFSYTCSEHINITDNQISLNFPVAMNDDMVLNPRAYGGAVFDMLSGTGNFAFRQNSFHGGTLIAQFYSSTKECTLYGNCSTPFLFVLINLSIH